MGSSGGVTYQSLQRNMLAPNLTVVDGMTVSSTGTFVPVRQDRVLPIDWRISEFEDLRAAVAPAAEILGAIGAGEWLPGAAVRGSYAACPDLFLLAPPLGTSRVEASLTYGNPFGEALDEFVFVEHDFSVELRASASAAPTSWILAITSKVPVGDLLRGSAPLRPELTPVRHLLVNGADATGERSGVTLTPTVSWDPPARGQPTLYRLTVLQISESGGRTAVRSTGIIHTRDTSVTLPPGLLDRRGEYAFVVAAWSSGTPERPFTYALPEYTAQAITGVVRP